LLVAVSVLVVTIVGSALTLRHANRVHTLDHVLDTANLVVDAVSRIPESQREPYLEHVLTNDSLFESIRILPGADGTLPEPLVAIPEQLPVTGVDRLSDGERIAFAAVMFGPESGISGVLYVSRVLSDRDSGISRVVGANAAGCVLLIAGLYVFLRRYAAVVNRPVERMRDAARRYATGDISFEWEPTGPPEIEGLAEDLHTMAVEMRNRMGDLSTQRNRLETILSSMIEGVVVVDHENRIVSMNAAAGELLGVEPEGGRGKTLLQYVRIAELDTIADAARESLEPVERTVTVYRDRAVHLQVHATSLPAEPDSHQDGVLLVLNNISRIKELEKIRTDFVANVSHELKTPVTSIKGFVETLIDESDLSTKQAHRFLGIILRQTNRLNSILEDLLSLSRIEQADQQLEITPCSVATIVDTSIDLCRAKAAARGITIERKIVGPAGIHANASLLEQAMVNLIDNAIKYSNTNSRIRVSATNGSSRLRLSVADEGQGIRRQDQSRVFERFYRTDMARSRELGGTGLGLAIVKHVALLHDGVVGVESTVGVGSTFTITIPQ